jgi:trigger factor
VIEREAERMINNLKRQFESQGLQFDTATLDSEHYKNISRLQAEKDIRARLVLDKIAEAEGIALDPEEVEEVFRDIAASYRMDVKKFKSQFGDSALMEKEQEKKLEDKVLKFIESEAVFVDAPEETTEPEAEPEPEAPEQV